jgi:hypothetical protein
VRKGRKEGVLNCPVTACRILRKRAWLYSFYHFALRHCVKGFNALIHSHSASHFHSFSCTERAPRPPRTRKGRVGAGVFLMAQSTFIAC